MKKGLALGQKIGLLFFLFLSGINMLYAQPLPPNPQSPLFRGATILVIIGIIFGVRKYYKSKKQE